MPVRPVAWHDLRQRLRERRRVFGAWTSLGHPSITEIFAKSGVAFLGIDLEHSTVSQEQAQRIIAAAHAGGMACLPRLTTHTEAEIKRLLDSGADGLIAPNVSTPAQVEQLVRWAKYPPLGGRSYGVARAQGYGFDFETYVTTWNTRSSLIIQIESIQGVEAAEGLLALPQVDGAMIGPYDISGSLGIPGRLEHPRVRQACERVIEACRRHRKACGTQVVDPIPENVAEALETGYTFIVLASDVFIFWKWAERMREIIERIDASPQVRRGAVLSRAKR